MNATSTASRKLGRNDPCPCGSGRKYKACCLKQAAGTTQPPVAVGVAASLERAWKAVAGKDVNSTLYWFGQVLAIEPDHAEALAGIGQALCWQERIREGLGYLQRAARQLEAQALKTRDVRFVSELAEQLHHWGDLDTALRLAELALQLAPDSPRTNNNLALYLSRVNRVEEALPYARKACALLPDEPACQNLSAILESRLGRHEAALAAFERIIKLNRNPQQTARACMELVPVLEKLGDYQRSFETCTRAHELHLQLVQNPALDRDQVFRSIAHNKAGNDSELLHRWEPGAFADALPVPIFLLGFLRSGTTLSEQVLGAHPDVFTSDENNLIHGLTMELRRITGCGDDLPAGLRRITLAQARDLRALYWRRVEEEYGPDAVRKRFVDKAALNTIDIGLIAALFPEAKILFALRDPRDVCLSCFQQVFQPAAVTINLHTWEGVARQYAAVMDLWLDVKDRLPLQTLYLRYEDTVNDFENTFRRVFDFLGLDWTPEVAAFHEKAKGRYIATPSFAAVSQPIYASSVARWRRYEQQFAPILPLLQRYIDEFGYGEGGHLAEAAPPELADKSLSAEESREVPAP